MKFWELNLDVTHYAHLAFVDETLSRRLISEFMGRPFSGLWKETPVYYPREWEAPGLSAKERKIIKALREGRPVGDFIYIVGAEGAFAISERARLILSPLLAGNVELLPLRYEGVPLHLVNVINVIDCLDQEKSEVKRLPNGNILWLVRPVFKIELLEGIHIFKLPQPADLTFVSDSFKKVAEENELKGLLWKPLP